MATEKKEKDTKETENKEIEKEEKKETKTTTTKKSTNDNKENLKDVTITGMNFKDELILIYLIPIIGLVFAFMKDRKVSDLLRFHYNQSATSAILLIVFAIFSKIPYVGILGNLVIIALVVFNIITLVKAYKDDETYSIPLVSDLSKVIFK